MTAHTTIAVTPREPALVGQTVVVIGGSAGIGLETARQARVEGADVILTARNPDRLQRAAADLGARSTAAFDATNPDALGRFFADLPTTIDHVMVTGPGPYYAALADLDRERAHRDFDDHIWLAVAVAQRSVGLVRPGGTLLFMGGTGGRQRGPGLSLIAAGTAATARLDRQPGRRDRPDPGQPDRGWLRRHAAVRVAARRRPGRAPRTAACHAAHQACRRPGRRRRARCAPHDQHRRDRCDL